MPVSKGLLRYFVNGWFGAQYDWRNPAISFNPVQEQRNWVVGRGWGQVPALTEGVELTGLDDCIEVEGGKGDTP